jgi:MraZ protein
MRAEENRSVPFFAGEFTHSLDPKNRVSIPAAWRRGEKTEFFVVPSPNHESLLAFPPVEFRGVSERVLSDASLAPRDKQTFLRQFNSKARLCPLDAQGRLLIPAEMTKLVGIGQSALLVGNDRRFEVWAPEGWSRKIATDSHTYQHVAEAIGL